MAHGDPDKDFGLQISEFGKKEHIKKVCDLEPEGFGVVNLL